jgi:hypothetical protein
MLLKKGKKEMLANSKDLDNIKKLRKEQIR